MMEGARGLYPLLQSSMKLYREMLEKERIECEWQDKGLLYVYKDRQTFDSYGETNDMLTEKFGETAVRIEGKDLREVEPALKDDLADGWHYEEDAHLRSDLLRVRTQEKPFGQRCRDFGKPHPDRLEENEQGLAGRPTGVRFRPNDSCWPPEPSPPSWPRSWAGAPIEPGKGYSMTMKRSGCLPGPTPDLPRDPGGGHALRGRIPSRLDHGIQRIRRFDPPQTAQPPSQRGRGIPHGALWGARKQYLVRLASHDL